MSNLMGKKFSLVEGNRCQGNWMGTVQYNDENGNRIDLEYVRKVREISLTSLVVRYHGKCIHSTLWLRQSKFYFPRFGKSRLS